MKRFLPFLFLALSLSGQTVPVNVQKTPGTNAITGNLVIGAGRTLTATGGGSITATAIPSTAITGIIPIGNLATGTPTGSKFIRDDGTLQTVSGTGTVTHSAGALTANAVMVGNGTDDSKVLSSLGTTTTVLHGNAAGLPTFGSVSLTADTTGTLPVANGGIGATTLTAHGVLIGNGTSAVAITGAGTAGQVLTSNGASADPTFQAAGGGGGGIAGSTGSTDNALIRADGTGGATVQSSSVIIDDAGAITIGDGSSGAYTGLLNFFGTTDQTTYSITHRSSTDAYGPGYAGAKSRGSLASPTAVVAGDQLAIFAGGGYGSAWNEFAGLMGIFASEVWTFGANGTEYRFGVTQNGSTFRSYKLVLTNLGFLLVNGAGDDGVNALQVSGSAKITGGLVGVIDGSDAGAGKVGESVISTIASGSAVSLTTGTGANVTSISLTAGDWDVMGNINFAATTATVTGTVGSISPTPSTIVSDGTEVYSGVQVTLLSETDSVTLPRKRVSVTSTTTIYLVGKSTFSAGSVAAFGNISARRVR